MGDVRQVDDSGQRTHGARHVPRETHQAPLTGRTSMTREDILVTHTPPSRLSVAMTWGVVAMTALLLALGAAWYGWSWQVHERFWVDVFGRLHGPMRLRFYLQPTLAFVAALK